MWLGIYRIAQNLWWGKYWRIWRSASNLSKFSLLIFSNCLANTGCLRDYPSTFSPSNFWMKPIHQYFPCQKYCAIQYLGYSMPNQQNWLVIPPLAKGMYVGLYHSQSRNICSYYIVVLYTSWVVLYNNSPCYAMNFDMHSRSLLTIYCNHRANWNL